MATNEDAVSVEMASLSVDGEADDDDGLVFGVDDGVIGQEDPSLCLVGRFLTNRPINFNAMEHTLAALWQPFEQVSVRREEGDLYVFQFYHAIDVQRVLDMRPCTFNNHLLPGFFSERVVARIGNELGVFLASDPYNFLGPRKSYVRLRYYHDLSKPIHKSLRMRKNDGAWFNVTFVYERAPSFCFICGLFDHTERFCRELLNLGNAPVVRKFGPELRANYRRPQSHGSRWLKGGGGENSNQGPSGIIFGNSITGEQTTPPNPVDNDDRDMDGIREDCLNSYPTDGEEVARGLEAGVTIVDPKRRRMGTENKKSNGEKPTMDHGLSGDLLAYDSFFSVDCLGRSGGLALLWRSVSSITLLSSSQHHIDIEVFIEGVGNWRLTGYYGEADRNFRHLSWQRLRMLASHHEAPWVCLGDFNDILSPSEKRGGRPQPSRLINGFRDALCDSGLIEFPMTGYPFTWEHGRNSDGWMESRLDRVFTNAQWRTRFSNSTAEVLGFSTSDHLPILLAVRCFVDQRHAHRFRFENTWLREAGCRTLISDIWPLSSDMDVEGKLVACRTALKSWGMNLRLLHKAEMDESLAIMTRLRGSRLQVHMDEFLRAKSRFFHLLNLREIFWKQRAKQFWLKEGLEEVMSGYFMSLFTSHDCNSEPVLQCVPLLVSHDHNASLLAPYSCDEIKSAAFSMKIDKSPGLDGFNPGFFQHYWDIIGEDVSRFCIDCLHSGSLPPKLNETVLVLIPKKCVLERMSDLRPIALCNVVYKIMTKMIVNRLKSILPSIVSESQSAFISGRSIQDNIVLAFEAMHGFNMFHRKKELSGALKMDISKAYDRLEWDFIRDMLIRMGFAQRWVTLVFSSNVQEVLELKRILRIYENAFGQLVNFQKSSLSFSKYTPVALRDSICSVLQIEEKPNLGNYLGLPSHVGSNKREVFSFVKDRLWKWLNSWKHRALSQVGKEVLLKTVLQALPNYVMTYDDSILVEQGC
ncbi:hypothetical protein MANES_06G103266v8 [Manihot esculenta]|uniref:Uncharacterized protein n=1 Tax=Manihot esculenta TaxID=3983 RepID=A0ACB7HKT1_MANES|nr:hypothetical protein MANES_06G103266v8 [Manihot esculenta]